MPCGRVCRVGRARGGVKEWGMQVAEEALAVALDDATDSVPMCDESWEHLPHRIAPPACLRERESERARARERESACV